MEASKILFTKDYTDCVLNLLLQAPALNIPSPKAIQRDLLVTKFAQSKYFSSEYCPDLMEVMLKRSQVRVQTPDGIWIMPSIHDQVLEAENAQLSAHFDFQRAAEQIADGIKSRLFQ